MRLTNMLERVNQEIKRRNTVVQIYSNREGCLSFLRFLMVETHESCREGRRYLDIRDIAEDVGPSLRAAAISGDRARAQAT